MSTLTLYCRSKNDTTDTNGTGITGDWCLSKKRLEENIGSTILLYSKGGDSAYRGGTISGFSESQGSHPTPRFKVFFKEDEALVGDARTSFTRKKGAANPVSWI